MINKLLELQKDSYSPYSGFKVSAILVDKHGVEHKGVNIENASYGPTNCAERSAVFSAISIGVKPLDFKEIHILGDDPNTIISPCGVCRQVLLEMAGPNAMVYQYSKSGKVRKNTVKELLPFGFSLT